MFKTISAAVAVSLMASASFAGSLNTDFEQEPEQKPAFVPTGSGIGAPAVIGGLLAAGAVIAIVASDDDDSSSTTTTVSD
ncbi:MAG: hypothetical protein ABJN72_13380 [Sulfitobacter sp.]